LIGKLQNYDLYFFGNKTDTNASINNNRWSVHCLWYPSVVFDSHLIHFFVWLAVVHRIVYRKQTKTDTIYTWKSVVTLACAVWSLDWFLSWNSLRLTWQWVTLLFLVLKSPEHSAKPDWLWRMDYWSCFYVIISCLRCNNFFKSYV